MGMAGRWRKNGQEQGFHPCGRSWQPRQAEASQPEAHSAVREASGPGGSRGRTEADGFSPDAFLLLGGAETYVKRFTGARKRGACSRAEASMSALSGAPKKSTRSRSIHRAKVKDLCVFLAKYTLAE